MLGYYFGQTRDAVQSSVAKAHTGIHLVFLSAPTPLPQMNNLVVAQDPGAGSALEPNAEVVITVGAYNPALLNP